MLAPRMLKIDQRRKKILELLARNGQVRVTELAAELGATPVTIRNDLAALEQDSYIERISGGAVQRVNTFFNMELHTHRQGNVDIKKQIAAATAALISDGENLFINSGTTTYYTAIELKKRKNLNIVTNYLPVAMELATVPGFTVVLLGGQLNVVDSFIYGINAIEQLRQYKADKSILSVDGISAESGLTTYHANEAIINRTMIERSREIIITADHTKIGYEGFSFVSDLNSGLSLVTDSPEEDNLHFEGIKKAGVRIIFAETRYG